MPAWRCWHRLHLDRPYWGGGMGPMVPGRIPWAAVRAWAEHHAMTSDEHEFLDHCIREMDAAFLDYQAEVAKRG